MSLCPCKSGLPQAECCTPYLDGERPAPSPEALMRSRYCAFVQHRWQYLLDTWHPEHGVALTTASLAEGPHPDWQRLEIVATPAPQADKGEVEFKAWYRQDDALHCLHERSRFVRLAERWYYLDGDIIPHPVRKFSRNDPCPCGSGKKFKKCCG